MKKYLVIVWSILAFASCKKNEEKPVHPIRQDITETVFASGALEADEKYNLVAQADGYLIQVNFDDGDAVVVNQVLAVIDNKTTILNTEAATAQLKIANLNVTDNAPALQQLQASIDFAEKKLQQDQVQAQRYKNLLESNSVARVEYENAALAVQNSQANLVALKDQYAALKLQANQQQITQKAAKDVNQTTTEYNKVKAIVGGKVLKRYKQLGDFVKRGETIAVIGKTNTIIAKVNVDESSIGKVKLGQAVALQLNTQKGKIYQGVVSEILPMFDDASQSFLCKVSFQTPLDFSIVGTQLEANIVVAEKKNALLIPRSFLDFGNKVSIEGKEEKMLVKTGIISTEWVEILAGLTEKDVLKKLKP
ncbi:MAG: efflux RND transporter periplasmic adaptor subunit [Spirosomataceae bacterium]